MITFKLGNTIRVGVEFTNLDPTSVKLRIRKSTASSSTEITADIVKDAPKEYHYHWAPTVAGDYFLAYLGDGTLMSADDLLVRIEALRA